MQVHVEHTHENDGWHIRVLPAGDGQLPAIRMRCDCYVMQPCGRFVWVHTDPGTPPAITLATFGGLSTRLTSFYVNAIAAPVICASVDTAFAFSSSALIGIDLASSGAVEPLYSTASFAVAGMECNDRIVAAISFSTGGVAGVLIYTRATRVCITRRISQRVERNLFFKTALVSVSHTTAVYWSAGGGASACVSATGCVRTAEIGSLQATRVRETGFLEFQLEDPVYIPSSLGPFSDVFVDLNDGTIAGRSRRDERLQAGPRIGKRREIYIPSVYWETHLSIFPRKRHRCCLWGKYADRERWRCVLGSLARRVTAHTLPGIPCELMALIFYFTYVN